MYLESDLGDKTKWLMRIEAAHYLGISTAELEQLENTDWRIKDAKEYVYLAFQHPSKDSGAHRDWGYRYNKEKLDKYLLESEINDARL